MLKNDLLELAQSKGINLTVEEMNDLTIEEIQNRIISTYKDEEILRADEKERERIQEEKKKADKRFWDILNGVRG